MKTRFLIIAVISVTVFLLGVIVYPYINETQFEDYASHDIKTALEDAYLLSDPICFVVDRTTSGETGSGVTMDACFTLKQFEEMGCTKPMLEHLNKHSNILAFESDGVYYLDFIGLPDGMSQEKFEECWDIILEKRTNLLENTKSELESEITPRYEKYLDENNELNFAQQYDNNGIIIDDLQRIYDWCDYTGEKPDSYFDWNNSTHHINSNNCEWIKTEKDLIEHMKNAVFDKKAGHYDYLPINNNPNMMAMEKITLQDNGSIDVEFGQNNYEWSTGYKPIPEFEYDANFKVNDTFVVLCVNIGKDGYADAHPDLSEPYLPGLGIVKYLGPITIENEPILLFWHESASIPVEMSCSYPEMIHHSINLWQLQEHGLPTDNIANALGSNYQK